MPYWWGRVALGCMSFPDTGCTVPNVGFIYLVWNYRCMGHCLCTYPPLWVFLSTDYLRKKRIGQVTSDLLYMIFIYYTKDNQQGSSRLSNWFSLRCLGPWMNHLPPVWWSTFRCQLVWMFDIWWEWIFILISCLLCMFKKITQILLIFYPLKLV